MNAKPEEFAALERLSERARAGRPMKAWEQVLEDAQLVRERLRGQEQEPVLWELLVRIEEVHGDSWEGAGNYHSLSEAAHDGEEMVAKYGYDEYFIAGLAYVSIAATLYHPDSSQGERVRAVLKRYEDTSDRTYAALVAAKRALDEIRAILLPGEMES